MDYPRKLAPTCHGEAAAAPINNPGTSAASTIAAPAATAASVATVPTTRDPKIELENRPLAWMKDIVKQFCPRARSPWENTSSATVPSSTPLRLWLSAAHGSQGVAARTLLLVPTMMHDNDDAAERLADGIDGFDIGAHVAII
jgi:hypothetical protein